MTYIHSDSDASLRRQCTANEDNRRSFLATQSNFKITQGVVEGLVGMESPEHIGMVYNVRLIDTGHLVRCRRLVNSASFDGVGEYNPLEEGDPVVVAFKEGMLQDGVILGCFYTEGTYKEFYVEGQGLNPREVKSNSVRSTEYNQPSIHPNRVAQPDAWVHTIGGKVGPYRDPALTDGSPTMKANRRPPPASIQIKNKLGDCGQWAKGDIIFYSDSNIILFSSQEGKSKCKRLRDMAEYYQQMVEEMEAFIGVQIEDEIEPAVLEDKPDKVRSLVNGDVVSEPSDKSINETRALSAANVFTSIGSNIGSFVGDMTKAIGIGPRSGRGRSGAAGAGDSFDIPEEEAVTPEPTQSTDTPVEEIIPESTDYNYTDDDRRNRRYINGEPNIDYMMYAPLIEYHLPQLKAMAAKCKELAITCKEDAANHAGVTNNRLDAAQIVQDACSALSSGGQLDDEKIEALAGGRICLSGDVRHYPFNKWKLDKSQGVEIGDLASDSEIKDVLVHNALLEAFKKMREAALSESGGEIDLAIASGYRDKEYLQKYGIEDRDCESLGGEFLPKPEQSFETGTISNTGKTGLVVIDPGHGAPDPGAVANGIEEATYVLEIAKSLASILNGAGIKTILTRETDAQVPSLRGAVDLATSNKANLFLSIHCNALAGAIATGFEVYRYHSVSDTFATNTVKALAANLPNLPDRGVNSGNFTVIKASSTIPSILVELGFITNPKEAEFMKQSDTKSKYVTALAQAIINTL
jgi:N-acetylmuramoyl-L-alanine amidase